MLENITPKTNFASKLTSIKSMFTKAYNEASSLNEKMKADIEAKETKIKDIQSEISEVKKTQNETITFLQNLEKLI